MSSSTARTRRSANRVLSALFAAAFIVAAGCVAPLSGPSPAASATAPVGAALGSDRIQIIHTNDIHGRLDATDRVASGSGGFTQGGLVATAAQIERLRARAPERTLVLDAGDAWQGTYLSNENKGQAVTKIMSLLRFDAQALGNHDLDWGTDILRQRAAEASFPLLCANCADDTGAVPAYLKPYIVKDLGLARVAVIGLILPDAASIIKASSLTGIRFSDAAAAVRRLLPQMRREADLVVAVTHLGLDNDRRLARDVPDIDVIVGGHSHTALRAAVTVGKTVIVQTGAYTANLGDLELVIDPATKKIAAVPTRSNELIAVALGAAPSSAVVRQVAAIVDERRAVGKKYTDRIVGRLVAPLDAPRAESGLGNLVTDALLDYGRQQGWKSDVAFYNMAGVRAPLPAGDITYGQLYQVLPFGNVVMSLDLTGAQLRAVFEAASGSAGRLHVAGATYTYRFANPAGQRLIAAVVGGAPIDPTRVYRVVTIDYLATGGDGHTELKAGTNAIFGDIEVDVVAAYLTARSPLDPRVEGRITQQ